MTNKYNETRIKIHEAFEGILEDYKMNDKRLLENIPKGLKMDEYEEMYGEEIYNHNPETAKPKGYRVVIESCNETAVKAAIYRYLETNSNFTLNDMFEFKKEFDLIDWEEDAFMIVNSDITIHPLED